MNSRKIILAKNPKLANSRNSRKFLPKISRIFPLAKVSSFKVNLNYPTTRTENQNSVNKKIKNLQSRAEVEHYDNR